MCHIEILVFVPGKNDTIQYIVVTHETKTLMAFENLRLMWAAQMMITPVQLKVARFRFIVCSLLLDVSVMLTILAWNFGAEILVQNLS